MCAMSDSQWKPSSENQWQPQRSAGDGAAVKPASAASGNSYGGWSSVQPPRQPQASSSGSQGSSGTGPIWSGPSSQPTAEWTGQPAPTGHDSDHPAGVLEDLFDFSFSRLMLPAAGGKLFMLVVIIIAAGWLFGLLNAVVANPADAGTLIFYLLSTGAQALLWIVLARVFIEGMTALARLADKSGR